MKILLVGIAGTLNDFLLSLHVLKAFVYDNAETKAKVDIFLQQYYRILPEDLDKRTSEIISDIEKVNPDVLGFSCYTWNIDAVRMIIAGLRQRNKAMKIILGGPEITSDDIGKGRFDDCPVEFLIFGEGENPFLSLLKVLTGTSLKDFRAIKGLAYREGSCFSCAEGPDILADLEDAPSAYLEGHISDELLLRPGIRANFETQRGCNFRCAYCFYHRNLPRIRFRNPEIVVEEIYYAYKKGIRAGRILDANFISNKGFAKKILSGLIDRKVEMSIFFEILPQFLDAELADLFGRYSRISSDNVNVVGMGIQTINQEALAVIRRKIAVEHFERAFKLLQEQKAVIKSDIILGLPRESKETYFKTIEFIAEKMRYGTNFLSLALLRILPGSDLVEIAEKENLTIDKRDSSHFVYCTPTMPREDLVECLRINTAAARILKSINIEKRMQIRDLYFEAKDSLGVTNIELLRYFAQNFFRFLKLKNVNYVKPDFPEAEYYYSKNVFNDIPDEWLIEKLRDLKKSGLPTLNQF